MSDRIHAGIAAALVIACAVSSPTLGEDAGPPFRAYVDMKTFMEHVLTPAANIVFADQFVGRTLTFGWNTATAALQGRATNITANTAGSTPTFTVDALTTAPSSGDTFGVSRPPRPE
jgi:hypothetical protein